MIEQTKFDNKNYGEIRNYLDAHGDLRRKISYGCGSGIYSVNCKNGGDGIKGIILNSDSFSILSNHPVLTQIKEDLEMIASKK